MTGVQSVLHPAGPQAKALADLWWYLFIACAAVWTIVTIALVVCIWRGTRRTAPDLSLEGTKTSTRWVSCAMTVTVLLLLSMLVATVAIGRSVSPFYDHPTREIRITGHQWWWQIQYTHKRADRIAETSNELHLPAGERVRLILESADVIHSLWIPNLHGKRDLIPGKKAILTIQADVPGVYRSQCAEFCGQQHAKMGLVVVVEPKAQFEEWLNASLLPAPQPKTAEQQHGQQLFLTTTCAMCHTIRGTSAGARTGPDLTHFASRRTIGSAILPNNTGNLHGWIADAQSIKPGVLMPPNPFAPDDLHALVAYMESLK
ncbi:MAG TPA: cytochrome c oxidase subunit II [Thermoanaerobaculia bacterium]|nr:cytochrome c oxidase subunit II [Thermoanaerobaculia bacterium]